MSCIDWFEDWAIDYTQVLFKGLPGWPAPVGSESWTHYFDGWVREFDEKSITQDEATGAAARVQADPPAYADRHLKALANHVDALRAEAVAAGRNDAGPEAARERSRGCPECSGCGWAVRRQVVAGRPSSFAMHCRCPYGRWLMAHHRARDDYQAGRIADLQAHPELWEPGLHYTAWSREPASRTRPPIAGAIRPAPSTVTAELATR